MSALPARFWAKVRENKRTGCWDWTAADNGRGYGMFAVSPGVVRYAHRLAYAELVGAIPEGLHLDHLCRRPRCVNPAHLDPVPPAVNTARGIRAQQTHCKRGHALSGDNLRLFVDSDGRSHRVCRTCAADTMRRYRDRQATPLERHQAIAAKARERFAARAEAGVSA